MDITYINPFFEAIKIVLPQLGFSSIEKGKLKLNIDNKTKNLGVLTIVGITGHINGNIIYNLSEDNAKKIASTMMMGMPITCIDNMVESAISEMSNMLTANTSMILEKTGIIIDISPPTLMVGDGYVTTQSKNNWIVVEIIIDETIIMEINISINS